MVAFLNLSSPDPEMKKATLAQRPHLWPLSVCQEALNELAEEERTLLNRKKPPMGSASISLRLQGIAAEKDTWGARSRQTRMWLAIDRDAALERLHKARRATSELGRLRNFLQEVAG